MCLSRPLADIIEVLGHDGSEVWNPDGVDITRQVVGFSDSELVLAAYKLGFGLVDVLTIIHRADGQTVKEDWHKPNAILEKFDMYTRFMLLLPSKRFKGSFHYVAHQNNKHYVLDPVEGMLSWGDFGPIAMIKAVLPLASSI